MAKKKLGKTTKGPANASSPVSRSFKKAMAAWKKAHEHVAKTTERINEAVRALIAVEAGSTKERTAEKATRRFVKELLAAKRKLRKAIRKRKKASRRGRRAKDGRKAGRVAAHTKAATTPAKDASTREAQRPRKRATVANEIGTPVIAQTDAS